jgi:hypothetical protein
MNPENSQKFLTISKTSENFFEMLKTLEVFLILLIFQKILAASTFQKQEPVENMVE